MLLSAARGTTYTREPRLSHDGTKPSVELARGHALKSNRTHAGAIKNPYRAEGEALENNRDDDAKDRTAQPAKKWGDDPRGGVIRPALPTVPAKDGRGKPPPASEAERRMTKITIAFRWVQGKQGKARRRLGTFRFLHGNGARVATEHIPSIGGGSIDRSDCPGPALLWRIVFRAALSLVVAGWLKTRESLYSTWGTTCGL